MRPDDRAKSQRLALTVDDVLADIRRSYAARAWDQWVADALAVAAPAA